MRRTALLDREDEISSDEAGDAGDEVVIHWVMIRCKFIGVPLCESQ